MPNVILEQLQVELKGLYSKAAEIFYGPPSIPMIYSDKLEIMMERAAGFLKKVSEVDAKLKESPDFKAIEDGAKQLIHHLAAAKQESEPSNGHRVPKNLAHITFINIALCSGPRELPSIGIDRKRMMPPQSTLSQKLGIRIIMRTRM